MATVVATMPSSNASHGSTTMIESQPRNPDAGPNGFTAVNGGSPESHGQSSHQRHNNHPPADRPSGTAPSSRETSPRQSNSSVGNTSPIQNGSVVEGISHEGYKRKRSDSSDHSAPSPRRYDYAPPKKGDNHQQHVADRALHVLNTANPNPPHSYYSTTPSGPDPNGYSYERPYGGPHHVQQHGPDGYQRASSEQRPPQQYTSSTHSGEHDMQDAGEDANSRPGIVQVGQKRKRNFSNRTKTGCMTCRHRKKKCDEGRPACENCTKGGFTCLGYSNVSRPGQWQKAAPSKQPVPLQSKDNDDQSPYRADVETPISANPSVHEGSHVRNLGDHDPRSAYVPTPTTADSRPPYSGHPSWPQHSQSQQAQTPQAYTPDGLPPFSELAGRPEPHRSEYSQTPSREMSRPNTQSAPQPPPTTSSQQWQSSGPPPASQPPSEYRQQPPYAPPRIDTHQPPPPPPPMRMSSGSYGYGSKPGSKFFSAEEVERSRMLRNVEYDYFDATLKNERQRCSQALARYNNACMLGSGISEQEARSMLMKVFDPSLDHGHSFLAPCKEKGILGPNVVIESGFRCTYGYNIRIMDNVFIGEGTRIDDSARVDIGARTWIGPDVTILTNDVSKDMVQRKGTAGQKCCATSVDIASEVVIGAGAKIYPGVKLGRGATVEPGAIVTHSLGENVTQKAFTGARMGGDPAAMGWDRKQ